MLAVDYVIAAAIIFVVGYDLDSGPSISCDRAGNQRDVGGKPHGNADVLCVR
jgi:hypothetical protein